MRNNRAGSALSGTALNAGHSLTLPVSTGGRTVTWLIWAGWMNPIPPCRQPKGKNQQVEEVGKQQALIMNRCLCHGFDLKSNEPTAKRVDVCVECRVGRITAYCVLT